MCGKNTQRIGSMPKNRDLAVHCGSFTGMCGQELRQNSMLNGVNKFEISRMRKDKQTLYDFSF